MTDKEETGDGEQDDISFLRTGDIVAMTCMASANREGVLGSERVCLCTEGFGNRMCSLENVSNRDVPPDIAMCMLYIDNALSVRALQEMMSSESELKGTGSSGGHKTLLYGHAVQLKHVQSEMYLACLSSCSSNDKLAFDVGVQENNEGEACWWTIHPASKQRSEGEKVRVGDDVILVSVATERYLHMTHSKGFMVIASFHQTLWNITSVSSGSIRIRNMGALFGNDVLRFFHGNDEVLTIPENWSEHPQHNMVIYEGGAAVSQARSLWRIELIRMKWHGALVGWEQPFRIRHITSGRYLGVMENAVQLYHKDKAEFDTTAFIMYQTKDLKKQMLEEKEEEGMGIATIHYGETDAFIQHIKTELWLSYQTSEVTKKGLGKVEEKKAVALKDGHMDDCFTFFMALEEESKSARVIRKCSSVLNRFLKGIEALQREGNQAHDWNRVDLHEVLKLMEDLIEYFAQPEGDDFEKRQNHLRALRSRQDLFQEEGVLNMILDTIDKFSQMEALPNFAGLLDEETQLMWEQISTYLYLLVAAMIKGNHYNCAQFASAQRLQWLFGRLSNPQSAEGILDVLYCVLTESPEALNMINESHIKSVISLLEKVGRDPKVLDVLSSLCEGNGMAVRSSQNTITRHLLPGKDLLLQTKMRDHVSSMTPNILVGVVEGSSQFRRWYYEAEVEHIETMTKTEPYLRVGWANSVGYKPFPGSGDGWGCNGVGDDFYSYGFDGRYIYCASKKRIVWTRQLQKGDIVGCSLDLNIPEIRFTVNGQRTSGLFKNFNIDGYFFPVMSLSAKVSCRFMFGGTQGRLRFGPPPGFSALIEAAADQLEIAECLSFGDIAKNVYNGPSTLHQNTEPFVPRPVDISNVVLPHFAMEIHQKLAENLHELWAMRKIELGWSYGEVRDERTRHHPCLTSFQQLPQNEKAYNINLAIDTMKTIDALGYHMVLDEPPVRLRPVRLPQNYQQSNGFKPQPLDAHEITLGDNMFPLIDALAKNTHNVWAKEKIRRGWTFGLNEFVDLSQKRSPHLVPYEVVDQRIKEANQESATEFIKALQLFGIFLEPPVLEHDEGAEKELKAMQALSRTYRAEALYAVSSGKWYFEFEVLTSGFMKVGWMDVGAPPTVEIGVDDRSYGFDGYLVRKWHQGAETYGREWKVGDIVGAFLDLNDRTISFSLNGELLLDPSGSEMAFDNVITADGFVPAMTLGAGQKARLNFGQDSNSLKYFTTCGLQEGYEPFCVNMYRQMPMWYAKRLPQFEDIGANSVMEVSRIPATGNNPPCLKITQKETDTGDMSSQEKAKMEYIRLSLPVKCNDKLMRSKDKDSIMRSVHEIEARMAEAAMSPMVSIRHPTIPKEFSDYTKENKKSSLGRSLLSAFRHSTEDDSTSGRSKPISLDDAREQLPEAPAISQRRRVLTLMHYGMCSVEDTILTWLPLSEEMAPTQEMKALTGLERMSGSMHELSSNEEHRETKNKRSGLIARFHQKKKEGTPNESKRTTDVLLNGHTASVDAISAESVPATSTTKDVQDMPRSGPGRTSSRRSTLIGKAKKDKNEMLMEHRRPSIVALEPGIALEGNVPDDDVQAMTELCDKIDEFYYAVRIFPGQDPANVWVGWVTPKYHFYSERFSSSVAVRRCKYQETDRGENEGESLEYRNCYVMNAAELLQSVPDAANTKVSGLLIGCIIDTSIGELSFLAAGQDTGFRYKLEPGAILYPAAFVAPSSAEILQFELGRIKYTFPLSSAMFKSSMKSLLPFCPPRLTVEKLQRVHWARVPNECLRTTALKLSDVRGWSVLCDDPVRIMSIYVPEKDMSYDVLEMIEHTDFLAFHRQTLNLYCKLAAHGNQKVAHILCSHVDEDQIMYAVKNHYLSGPLRQGFHDFLIAVHLKTYENARQSAAHEYVIPLKQDMEIRNVFLPENEDRFPQILGPTVSVQPVMVCSEVRTTFGKDAELKLLPPTFNFVALKAHVMSALRSETEHAVINCRDLIGGNCLNHFEPLFKLFNSLLVIGLFDDDDLKDVFKLIHPIAFDENYVPGSKQKGLTEIELAEGVKIQLSIILDNLCDMQLRHRVESLISFAAGFVSDLQQDQCARYMSIKQTDMSPAEAAKRTKEFRCPPREQMFRLLKCKAVQDDSVGVMLDEEVEYDQCPMDGVLQEQLRGFCSLIVNKVGCVKNEEEVNEVSNELVPLEDVSSWVDQLARLVIHVPPPPIGKDDSGDHNGTENFRHMICTMLKSWATLTTIESNELIRRMFNLLLRQYTGVAELMKALSQTYVLHERNLEDVQDFIENLIQVRELLNVQFESAEEAILKRGLWKLMNNRIFFQHPDLMRLLTVHEDVMSIMVNVLTAQQGAAEHAEHAEHLENIEEAANTKALKDASEMVVACSRFLCYFCRTSRHNQKAMFEHLSFLLDNATMLLARPSLRGSVPLDVAYSSFMDNNELALALKEEELDKVAVYLSRCGLQPNSELISKGYPDIGWDPVEGERYIDFLRFCVWINGESVEENANLVIRLLIRRPECLGIALKGEGQGLFAAFKEAIALSEDIRALEEDEDRAVLHSGLLGEQPHYPSKEVESEDYIDLGAATLDFYSSLVDLLAKCAPDRLNIQAGKGDSVRARAILRSLISLDDLGQILSLCFTIPNLTASTAIDENRKVVDREIPGRGAQRSASRKIIGAAISEPYQAPGNEQRAVSPPSLSSYSLPTHSTAQLPQHPSQKIKSATEIRGYCRSYCTQQQQPSPPEQYEPKYSGEPRAQSLGGSAAWTSSSVLQTATTECSTVQSSLASICKSKGFETVTGGEGVKSAAAGVKRKLHIAGLSSIPFGKYETAESPESPPSVYHTPVEQILGKFPFVEAFKLENEKDEKLKNAGPLPGLLPNHKQSVLLFLDRVYGIDSQEMLFQFLEKSFLPDLRAATMMDSPRAVESDTALALNRYLCNAVLPLLTNHSYYFADAEHHAALLDATLHTVYRMNRLRSLTKNQRDAVSDFLVAITRELPPAMMVKLMRKVIVDIEEMTENVLVPLRILTLHYERCTKYYGSGNVYGMASETEKRLSMLLFYAIFDSLGSKPYDPELFGKALPCLTAIGSAISPDYTLTTAIEDADKAKTSKDRGVWNPEPVDVSKVRLGDDLQSIITKFAEHFHDSWASRKLEKGWIFGDLYSRQAFTHPRLKPFSLLRNFEQNFYKERCAECLRALLAWGYSIELTDRDAVDKAAQSHTSSGTSIENFNPKPVDLSNMTLEKDMTSIAEKMAEQSHKIWAKKVFADLTKGGNMPPQLVPWDLLTDFERRKDRFRAAEILKFLQYHGYRVWSPKKSEPSTERIKTEERGSVEKRFAYNLLEKLIQYLEQASMKMKTIKPSQELTRRNSFKKEGQDVKFFEKVVLPLMLAYFNAHKNYFLASSSIVQTGMASDKEKEMVANLFCRLASLLRIKKHAFGSVAKITVRCLQGLTQALDLRTLVKANSDIVRTGLLTFFNNCAEDLFVAVTELQNGGQYSLLRGQNLTSWVSLEFANQMIIPVLTTMFAHLARNHFGSDLLLDEIQAACYKILDSAYLMNSLAPVTAQRKSMAYEIEKHRPALGQCLAAFAGCFPVAFLEAEFNKNNKYSVLAKTQDQSVQVQEMLQNLSAHIPKLDKLLTDVEQVGQTGAMYRDQGAVYDVDLPLICSYLTYWWQFGPDSSNRSSVPVTNVDSEHINRIFRALLQMLYNHIGVENASWLCRINFFAVQIIPYVSCDPVKEYILPVAERLRRLAEKAYKDEEHMRTHPDDADEGTIAEDNARLVRDVYAFFPVLMKYTDLHRAQWLKTPSWETDGIYENVAVIFKIWSLSQHFKREELNFMAQYEDESVAIGTGEMKTGKAAIAERKKKRREGQIRKDKHANSIVIACLKRLLPVGLNVFGGRELDIVQHAKEKFLAKEPEDKIREFVRSLLDIPAKTDPTDKNAWQLNLYRKIGKSQMRGKDVMTQDGVVEKITNMGQVVAILHVATRVKELRSRQRVNRETGRLEKEDRWKHILTLQRKRMAISLITASHLYRVEMHRAINYFLPAFSKLWLEEEDVGQDALIKELMSLLLQGVDEELEQTHAKVADDELLADEKDDKSQGRPDPLGQLIQCFQRAATSEQSQTISIANDSLFVNFAQVMSKSVHIEEEDEGGDDEGELDQAQKEEISQALRAEQAVLADRGAAIMCLMYLSASNGEPSDMVAEALQLGIHLLNGGNVNIQKMLIDYLQLKKDVRFFTSLAGLMNKCSVLNLEMFERQIKAEGLGMGAELAAGDNQNLNDSEFTCSLFRFLQLTCEGHNLEFQNYLRTQPGHTTSVNLINCTVDYLLRLQESVMDFYWHYSSKEVIDEGGKEYFLRAIQVCSQVFNTLTECIQGPCTGNQMTLANSRLWDAINGFFFLFAHMMEKLYKNSTQLELLREFLNLQKDMIVLMLSMLEGNVLNGPIGKQMVDALIESEPNVEMILKFSDMFLKLKDLTTSQAFQDFDTNRDGWISPKEFQRAMESQKMYTVEEITYLMMCTDVNNDGKVDYMEFTERFHNPARDIGFNLAVLLTNLKEHITNDPRLEKIVEKASSLLDYFDPYLGRIEIMGSSKRVEKIYFEIQESWLEQWSKQQIRDSKNSFLFNVLQDDGGDQGKLEAFINFCEDTIFEMQHAAEISAGDTADSKIERAKKQRDYFLQQTSAGAQISATFKTGFHYGMNAANALKPSNVKKALDTAAITIQSMTWAQLIVAILSLSVKASVKIAMFLYLVGGTLMRFGYYLMTSERDELEVEQAALPMPENSNPQYSAPVWPPIHHHRAYNYDVFGVRIPAADTSQQQMPSVPQVQLESETSTTPTPMQQSESTVKSPVTVQQASSLYETQSIAGSGYYGQAVATPAVSEYGAGDYYEPKIAEQIPSRSRGSLLNVLARNFKTIEKTTLYLAFFINVILLFHRVQILHHEELPDRNETDEEEDEELVYITGMTLPYTSYGVSGWMLAQLLYWISVLHASASFALLVSFYQLKIPLITFKREKEVARRLMFDGCWLTEEDDEERSLTDTVFWYIDRIVISSKSFPMKYWDKFVRRKTKHKFRDQVDEETLAAVLGEDKRATDTTFDYRYTCWLWLGVILTNGQFLYRVHYLLCSACGVFVSPFFYAFHLIDVVLSFPMLKAILQSVTHNLQQLILTIMMTLVVVYLYTVLAFNFFRKFFVQESEEGEEPDRKCHNMLTCFIYHFYAGVRAGGGIGDELESPYGDDLEYWRMLYDISFFFFVIVILVAIMQGLIIDAFGELRDQQESATEKLESSCFICDIGKDTFDRLPRGFEIHTSKEHNFANYLFFLQHLVNKDETEYTGQETYVREKYDNRDWEFFPVGECFVKQYEDQLLQS